MGNKRRYAHNFVLLTCRLTFKQKAVAFLLDVDQQSLCTINNVWVHFLLFLTLYYYKTPRKTSPFWIISKLLMVMHAKYFLSKGAIWQHLISYCRLPQTWDDVSHLTFIFSNLLWPNCKIYFNETNCIQKFHISTFYADFFRFLIWIQVF